MPEYWVETPHTTKVLRWCHDEDVHIPFRPAARARGQDAILRSNPRQLVHNDTLPQRSTEPLIYTMLLQLIRAVLVPSCHTRFHKHTHTHTVFTVPDWPTFRSNEAEFLNILFFNYHNILDFRFTIFENNIFKNSVSLIGMLARAAATSGWFDASV